MAAGNQSPTVSQKRPAFSKPPFNRDDLNPPNLITLSRLALAFVLFVLIYLNGYWITAAALFLIAAATDAIDGYIARKYGMVTTLGRILDPFADKMIICGAFVFLLDKKVPSAEGVLASGVNAWMVIIVIGREMFITSLRGFLEQHGRDFSASFSGKIKMITQCMAVTASLLSLSPHVSGPAFNMLRDVLLWGTVVVTVYSGVDYVVRATIILRREPLPAE
jgi:CDP-diacylglycerol--glycerol-3-phosphate 3-phosphatidyltransferase